MSADPARLSARRAPRSAPASQAPRRRKATRRREILEAAREVFLEAGLEHAAIKAIAARAGCVEGTLYTYFESKRAIFDAVLADFYDRLIADIEPHFMVLGSTRDRLAYLVARHLRIAIDDPGFARLIADERRAPRPYAGSKLHALNRRYSRFLMTTITDGIARGELRDDIDPTMVRDLIFGGVEHWLMSPHSRRDSFVPAKVASTMVDLWLSGMRPAAADDGMASLARRVSRLERKLGAHGERDGD
ncbi:MAG: TetR family transcriptional regulator [Burkholderiaceae bacterium]|nr:TetR family transcriptional regulator [Burkholderiaceae bacterium]